MDTKALFSSRSTTRIKLRYWQEVWAFNCYAIKGKHYDVNSRSPRTVINDLIKDIEAGVFKRAVTKNYYREQLRTITTNYPAMNVYSTEIKLLQIEMERASDTYIIQICESIRLKFLNGLYFKQICQELKKLLIDAMLDTATLSIISELTRNAVLELYLNGFTIENILRIPGKILAGIKIIGSIEHGYVETEYPLKAQREDYLITAENWDSVFDICAYNQDAVSEMASLQLSDRIERLSYYFEFNKKEPVRYIFPVSGLFVSDEIDIGSITFYNSNQKSYIKNIEALEVNFSGGISQINATVVVDHGETDSGFETAAEKINRAIELLRVYQPADTITKLHDDRYITCTLDGDFLGQHWPPDINDYHLNGNKKDDLKTISTLLECHPHSDMQAILLAVLRWHRKAVESISLDDKLLCYWISLESILSKKEATSQESKGFSDELSVILEGLPCLVMDEYIRHFIIELMPVVRHLAQRGRISIRQTLFNALSLPPQAWVLEEVLDVLPTVRIKTGRTNHFLLEKLDNAIRF